MTKYDQFTLYLRIGVKGSGKSLLGAKDMIDLLQEYKEVEKKYPQLNRRILLTGERLSPEYEKDELVLGYNPSTKQQDIILNPNGHLYNWNSPKQLKYCPRPNCWLNKTNTDLSEFGVEYEHQNNPENKHPLHDADVYWPEVSTHFSAEESAKGATPRWIKSMLAYARKRSLRFFMDCQEYDDLAISFRRQLKGGKVFWCTKLYGSSDISASKPRPVSFTWPNFLLYMASFKFLGKEPLWGRIAEYEFDPRELESVRDELERVKILESRNSLSQKVFIRAKYVNAYNTAHEIPPYKPNEMEHVMLWCENDDCPVHGRELGKPKIEHFKI